MIPDYVLEVLEDPSSIKMIGTIDTEDNVIIEPVKMVETVDKDIIAFPCSRKETKTVENMIKRRYVSLAIFQPDIIAYQIKGVFKEVVENGELFDRFKEINKSVLEIVKFRVTEIYALTMAIAGDRIV